MVRQNPLLKVEIWFVSHWLGKQSDAPPEAGPGPTIPAATQTWGNEVSQDPQKEFPVNYHFKWVFFPS